MKILLTGASSFTGYWFAKTLAANNHDVTCAYTAASAEQYAGVRRERVALLDKTVAQEFGVRFGDEKFIRLLRGSKFDLLCHHAADVRDYKSPEFKVLEAVSSNTSNVAATLAALADHGSSLVLTGSVFEGGEGAGSDSLPHFSPYGLSKSLTAQVFEYYARNLQLNYGKFVIPNPFGPYEEPRFTAYLMKSWLKGEVPKVNAPDYVRDNIHVKLLARYYHAFCEEVSAGGWKKISPSGIVCSQGLFTQMVAREAASRLNLSCDFILEKQTQFTEPLMRVNTDKKREITEAFSEREAWDEFVEYYEEGINEV